MREIAIRRFMKNYGKYLAVLAFFLAASYVMLYLTYENVRREMIDNLNARQMIHARQAAKAVESYLHDQIALLKNLAGNEHIVTLDTQGKRLMGDFFTHHKDTGIIARIDRQGRILHSEPYNPKVIHQRVSKFEDFQEVRRSGEIVVSDVFTSQRGSKTIILHVPVYKRKSFNGTIALLFPFHVIAKRFVEDIRIGTDGYAWVIDRSGIELSCPVPGHVGNSVFDNCRDFPDILAMAQRMIRGEQGTATYRFNRIRESVVTSVTKQAVFMPIRLGNNFWSIVVATPEDEALGAMEVFRNRLLLIALIFVIGIGLLFYMLFRNRLLVKEIEKRQITEEALRDSEENYRNIFENAVMGIFLTTPGGRYLRANPAGARMYGYDSPEDIIHSVTDMSRQVYANPEDRERFKEIMADKGRVEGFESEHCRKDGRRIWTVLNSRPVRDDAGEILYYETTIEDITERKRAEQKRQELEERLRRSEKMESLGMLAGGVAHDLNNILGVMTGYSELTLLKLGEADPLREHVRNIMTSSERAAAIIQDMLTLARRGVSGKEVTKLNTVIANQMRTPEYLKLSSYYPRVWVKAELEPDLLNIKGSPVHLGKTVMNLLSNAAESIRGEGTVTLRTANRYLDRPVSGYDDVNPGDYVVLTVSDTGEGISPDDLKRIFEPFYTKKIMGRSGTGLGLSVVWGTVKDHEGYIDVESRPGRGTTFTLYFPVTREEPEKESPVAPADYMGRGETLLVVDDVPEQRDLAARMLTGLHYGVVTVSGGEEAVEYLREHDVDLVILDMIMDPGIDGLETYQWIVEIKPGQKAVIVSGYAETDRVKRAQELGAGPFVKKPYILEKIGLAVRRELDRK